MSVSTTSRDGINLEPDIAVEWILGLEVVIDVHVRYRTSPIEGADELWRDTLEGSIASVLAVGVVE